MTFDDYSKQAEVTAKFEGGPKDRLSYLMIALAGEVGEVCNALKKVYRHKRMPNEKERKNLLMEAGDSLWYLDRFVVELQSTLGDVAKKNIKKLHKRYNIKQGKR